MPILHLQTIDAEGTPLANVRVVARLMSVAKNPGYVNGGGTIVKEVQRYSKGAPGEEDEWELGDVDFTLVSNELIYPAGTYWRIEEFPSSQNERGKKVSNVSLPDDDLTHDIEDVLVDVPEAIESAALTVHRLSVGDHADVDLTGNATGKALMWNGTNFVPADTVATDLEAAGLVAEEAEERAGADELLAQAIAAEEDARELHEGRTDNPHGVTAAQTGALTQAAGDTRYARLAASNTFTAQQIISASSETLHALTVRNPFDRGDLGDKIADFRSGAADTRVAQMLGSGFRIHAQDGHGDTDWAEFRWNPDEFGIFVGPGGNREGSGQLTNGDLAFYTYARIRMGMTDPHLNGSLFELREDYLAAGGGYPVPRSEFIPFRVRHGWPNNGSGVWDYFHIKPDFSRLGLAANADGYRVISVDVTDASGGAGGIKQLLRLALAGVDKFTVTSAGAVTAAGAGAFSALTAGGVAVVVTSDTRLTADQAAGTASIRTLGTGATQAAAGNDARFTDQRVPTDGSVTDAKVAAGAAIADSKLALTTVAKLAAANTFTVAQTINGGTAATDRLNLGADVNLARSAANTLRLTATTVSASGQISADGRLTAFFGGTYFGSESGTLANNFMGGIGSSMPTFVIRSNPSDNQDIIRVQNGAGTTTHRRTNRNGYDLIAKTAAPTDAEMNANELAIWLDNTPGASKAMFKAKDSGGTVRTASVALA